MVRARGAAPRPVLTGVESVNQSTTFLAPQVSSRWVTAGEVHVGAEGDVSRVARVSPSRGTQRRASVPDAPDADPDRDEPQRRLQGLALGGREAYTSACADPDVDPPGTAPDCRIVRTTLTWRTRTRAR